MGVGQWTIKAQGVGESLASLVLRARLILLRSSRLAGGVGGPRAHASRIASTSAFSAAKFRSAVAAGDGSPSAMAAGDCSGPGGDASDARGFVDAVDETSSLSLVSGSGMVMMNFSLPETSQNVSRAPLAPCKMGIADNRLGLQPYAASHNVKLIEDNMPPEGLLLARPHVNLSRGRRPHRPPPRSFQKTCKGFEDWEGTCPWSSFTGPFHESKSPDSPLSVFVAEASGLTY